MDKSHFSQIVVGVAVGAILGGGGVYLQFASRFARAEARLDALVPANNSAVGIVPAGAPSGGAAQPASIHPLPPDSIVALSAEVQRAYVHESFGEFKGQNFSEDDLAEFQKGRIAQTVVDSLRNDARFLAIVLGLRATDATVRQSLMRRAGQPVHRTWAECGKVSRECQTDAGRKAEQALAQAIVREINSLLKRTPNEIRRLAVP